MATAMPIEAWLCCLTFLDAMVLRGRYLHLPPPMALSAQTLAAAVAAAASAGLL